MVNADRLLKAACNSHVQKLGIRATSNRLISQLSGFHAFSQCVNLSDIILYIILLYMNKIN